MSGRESILRKCQESVEVQRAFFEANADRIDAVAAAMAARFRDGGKLYTMGNGGSACDALHMAVEFKHPIIEKRRALPAEALVSDPAIMSAIGNDLDFSQIFVNQLRLTGRPGDIAVAISTSGKSPNVIYGLEAARELGMLTLGLSGKDGGRLPDVAGHALTVLSFSIHRIQEVHAALIHVLWDAVHVALGEEDVI